MQIGGQTVRIFVIASSQISSIKQRAAIWTVFTDADIARQINRLSRIITSAVNGLKGSGRNGVISARGIYNSTGIKASLIVIGCSKSKIIGCRTAIRAEYQYGIYNYGILGVVITKPQLYCIRASFCVMTRYWFCWTFFESLFLVSYRWSNRKLSILSC